MKNDITVVGEVVVEAFNIELLHVGSEEQKTVLAETMLKIWSNNRTYMFFSPSGIKHMTETIFEDTLVRDLLLSVTDRVLLYLVTEDSYNSLCYDVSTALSINRHVSSLSLIHEDLTAALETNPDTLTNCLKNNSWLLVMYLLLLNFHTTDLYIALRSEGEDQQL